MNAAHIKLPNIASIEASILNISIFPEKKIRIKFESSGFKKKDTRMY